MTHDTEVEEWANKGYVDLRKDIIIELFNEVGQLVLADKAYRCWVSEYQAMPDVDANGRVVVIEIIKLENEGWKRNRDVTEPTKPNSIEPA